jgi:hypothetical protein
MRADESVDPPRGLETREGPDAPPAVGPSAAAPLVEVPKRTAASSPRSSKGLGASDIVVAVLALVVLGLSLVGLAWVLRSK